MTFVGHVVLICLLESNNGAFCLCYLIESKQRRMIGGLCGPSGSSSDVAALRPSLPCRLGVPRLGCLRAGSDGAQGSASDSDNHHNYHYRLRGTGRRGGWARGGDAGLLAGRPRAVRSRPHLEGRSGGALGTRRLEPPLVARIPGLLRGRSERLEGQVPVRAHCDGRRDPECQAVCPRHRPKQVAAHLPHGWCAAVK